MTLTASPMMTRSAIIDRYDQIITERGDVPASLTPPADPEAALGVLAEVLNRDGQQLPATQTRNAVTIPAWITGRSHPGCARSADPTCSRPVSKRS